MMVYFTTEKYLKDLSKIWPSLMFMNNYLPKLIICVLISSLLPSNKTFPLCPIILRITPTCYQYYFLELLSHNLSSCSVKFNECPFKIPQTYYHFSDIMPLNVYPFTQLISLREEFHSIIPIELITQFCFFPKFLIYSVQ